MPNYMKNGGEAKSTKATKKAVPMAKAVVDDSEPTAKELKELEQIKKDMDQQRDEDRGADQPKRLDYVEPFKDGGMVSKGRGNGIAIRGIRKCKMS